MNSTIKKIILIVIIASVVVLGGAFATDIFTEENAVVTEAALTNVSEADDSVESGDDGARVVTVEAGIGGSDRNSELDSQKTIDAVESEDKEEAIDAVESEDKEEAIDAADSEDKEETIDYTAKRIEYIRTVNKEVSEEDAAKLVGLFEEFSEGRDYITVELVMGIARLESTYRVDVGEKYIGLMQVSAYYGQLAGYTLDQLKDPYYNLKYAFEILDDLNNKCNGNTNNILQAYNMGYYALKKKLDAGEELSYSFYNTCKKYADQIVAMYEE